MSLENSVRQGLSLVPSDFSFSFQQQHRLMHSDSSVTNGKMFGKNHKNYEIAEQEEEFSVFLQFSPLVGGPQFLSIHSAIVLENFDKSTSIRFDFLPKDASNPNVLLKLITFQSVPGLVRLSSKQILSKIGCFRIPLSKSNTTLSLSSIEAFCENFRMSRGELSLVSNNCYHFCYLAYIDLLAK